VTRTKINKDTFGIFVNGLSASLQRRIEHLFPIKVDPLDKGVKYLGFYLKPNNYKYVDWLWLFKKIELRIKC
jgi:hypothetical protein